MHYDDAVSVHHHPITIHTRDASTALRWRARQAPMGAVCTSRVGDVALVRTTGVLGKRVHCVHCDGAVLGGVSLRHHTGSRAPGPRREAAPAP